MQAKDDELMNAQLSDICISTSAAPTYLPAHYFKTNNHKGEMREFNLIDGGVAANNPVSKILKAGEKAVKKSISRVNLETCDYKIVGNKSNREAE
ncbi:hypothetical protein BHE74_00040302 [Ensete ventricosum]|nr:hypothetical protein BHE74_00040302 [Ensete ventricosum]